jgi:hypothetical protein
LITLLVFKKNANFFRRKLEKIAENCDHNIDPRFALCLTSFCITPISNNTCDYLDSIATEETVAMSREIESRQGVGTYVGWQPFKSNSICGNCFVFKILVDPRIWLVNLFIKWNP